MATIGIDIDEHQEEYEGDESPTDWPAVSQLQVNPGDTVLANLGNQYTYQQIDPPTGNVVTTITFGAINNGDGTFSYAPGIASITIVSGGTGYTSAPIVSFSFGNTQATATVNGGVVTDISIDTPGGGNTPSTGYTSAPIITLTGGGGTGASATATLSTLAPSGTTAPYTTTPSDVTANYSAYNGPYASISPSLALDLGTDEVDWGVEALLTVDANPDAHTGLYKVHMRSGAPDLHGGDITEKAVGRTHMHNHHPIVNNWHDIVFSVINTSSANYTCQITWGPGLLDFHDGSQAISITGAQSGLITAYPESYFVYNASSGPVTIIPVDASNSPPPSGSKPLGSSTASQSVTITSGQFGVIPTIYVISGANKQYYVDFTTDDLVLVHVIGKISKTADAAIVPKSNAIPSGQYYFQGWHQNVFQITAKHIAAGVIPAGYVPNHPDDFLLENVTMVFTQKGAGTNSSPINVSWAPPTPDTQPGPYLATYLSSPGVRSSLTIGNTSMSVTHEDWIAFNSSSGTVINGINSFNIGPILNTPPVLLLTGGSGNQPAVPVTATVTGGVITGLSATSGIGSAWTVAPTVTVYGGSTLATINATIVSGSLSLAIVNGGAGYDPGDSSHMYSGGELDPSLWLIGKVSATTDKITHKLWINGYGVGLHQIGPHILQDGAIGRRKQKDNAKFHLHSVIMRVAPTMETNYANVLANVPVIFDAQSSSYPLVGVSVNDTPNVVMPIRNLHPSTTAISDLSPTSEYIVNSSLYAYVYQGTGQGINANDMLVYNSFSGVDSITVTAGGSGYVIPPTVSFSGGLDTTAGVPNETASATAVLTSGAITSINIDNPGTGYISNPSITITAATGDPGTGGTASCTASSPIDGVSSNCIADIQTSEPDNENLFIIGRISSKVDKKTQLLYIEGWQVGLHQTHGDLIPPHAIPRGGKHPSNHERAHFLNHIFRMSGGSSPVLSLESYGGGTPKFVRDDGTSHGFTAGAIISGAGTAGTIPTSVLGGWQSTPGGSLVMLDHVAWNWYTFPQTFDTGQDGSLGLTKIGYLSESRDDVTGNYVFHSYFTGPHENHGAHHQAKSHTRRHDHPHKPHRHTYNGITFSVTTSGNPAQVSWTAGTIQNTDNTAIGTLAAGNTGTNVYANDYLLYLPGTPGAISVSTGLPEQLTEDTYYIVGQLSSKMDSDGYYTIDGWHHGPHQVHGVHIKPQTLHGGEYSAVIGAAHPDHYAANSHSRRHDQHHKPHKHQWHNVIFTCATNSNPTTVTWTAGALQGEDGSTIASIPASTSSTQLTNVYVNNQVVYNLSTGVFSVVSSQPTSVSADDNIFIVGTLAGPDPNTGSPYFEAWHHGHHQSVGLNISNLSITDQKLNSVKSGGAGNAVTGRVMASNGTGGVIWSPSGSVQGVANSVLTNDGSGVLSWAAGGGGGTYTGGTDIQVTSGNVINYTGPVVLSGSITGMAINTSQTISNLSGFGSNIPAVTGSCDNGGAIVSISSLTSTSFILTLTQIPNAQTVTSSYVSWIATHA